MAPVGDLTQTSAAAPAAGDRPPAQIGRHRVDRVLGAGGMGVVYAAYDADLERPVAIKVLRERSGGIADEHRARFLREARAMARVTHHNVITVHEVGTDGDIDFVAMELIDGQSLADWLTSEKRSAAEVLAVFRRAGEGLAAAHDAGLVHRDFKPHNVLVGRDGRVVVTDFGLARAASEAVAVAPPPRAEPAPGGQTPTLPTPRAELGLLETLEVATPATTSRSFDSGREPLTRTGVVLGTPAYMPPEQHAGGAADPRSDQFSFCVALWEGLVGQRPFSGNTSEELRAAIDRGLPSDAGKPIAGAVRRVLRRGLARDPAARWPSLRHLLGALDRAAARRKRLLAAAAVALVGVVAVAARALWPAPASTCGLTASLPPAPPALERARRDWLEARQQVCAAEQPARAAQVACLADARERLAALSEAISAAPADVARAADPAELAPDPASCAREVPPVAPSAAPPGAEAARRRARVALATAALGVRSALVPPDQVATALTAVERDPALAGDCVITGKRLVVEGALEVRRGNQELARDAFERAAVTADRCGDPLDGALAAVALLREADRRETAPDQLEMARGRAETAVARAGNPPWLEAEIAAAAARTARRADRIDEAIDRGLQVLAVRRSRGLSGSAATVDLANSLSARNGPGDPALARALVEAARVETVSAFGPDDPRTLALIEVLVGLDWIEGDLAAARRSVELLRAAQRGPVLTRVRAWRPSAGEVPVHGRVVDASGAPVPGAEVAFGREINADALGLDPLGYSLSTGFSTRAFAITGADGRFEARTLPEIVAVAAAGDQRSLPVVVEGDELELTLAPTGTLRGKVTFAAPRPPFSVILAVRDGQAALVHLAPIAADGTWVLDCLPPGRYAVNLQGGTERGEAMRSAVAQVAVGQHNPPIELVWRRGDLELEVVVRGDRSVPIAFAQAFLAEPGVTADTVRDLRSALAAGRIWHFGKGTPVGRRPEPPLEPGDLVVRFDGVTAGAVTLCVLPLSEDVLDPVLMARMAPQTEDLDVVCEPYTVAATPTKQSIVVETAPMRRLR